MYITIEPGLHQTNIIMLSTLERKNEKSFVRTGALIWNGLPKSLKSLRNLNLNPKSNKFSWSFFTQNVQTDSQNVRTWRTRDWTKVDSSIYLNGTVTNAKVSATLVTVQISTNLYIIFSFHHLLTYWFCKPSYYYILYQLE